MCGCAAGIFQGSLNVKFLKIILQDIVYDFYANQLEKFSVVYREKTLERIV
jgi:hypothetical protein